MWFVMALITPPMLCARWRDTHINTWTTCRLCLYEYVCKGFTAFITALMVLRDSYQDSVLSVSVRRVKAVFSTAEFKGEGK